MNRAQLIILVGRPGCGKGTQAQFISNNFQIPLISTGDILRKMSEEDANLAKKMSEGVLLPPELVNGIMIDAIGEYIRTGEQVMLDGYPRSLEQAAILEAKYPDLPQAVLYFQVPSEILIKRITGRFTCSKCAKIYNSYYNPPKVDNICDNCGNNHFIRRADDTEEIIKKRLAEYDRQTLPLIDYYNKKGILRTIDANQDIENIRLEVSKLMTSV